MLKDNLWQQLKQCSMQVARGLLLGYYIRTYIGEVCLVEGPSMEPTLSGNAVVLVDKISVLFRRIKRSEIASVRLLADRVLLCKRVTGIEGDTKLTRDNRRIVVPKECIWIEGDNKLNSLDSRVFGPIKNGLVLGRVIMQVYPKLKWLFTSSPNEICHQL